MTFARNLVRLITAISVEITVIVLLVNTRTWNWPDGVEIALRIFLVFNTGAIAYLAVRLIQRVRADRQGAP